MCFGSFFFFFRTLAVNSVSDFKPVKNHNNCPWGRAVAGADGREMIEELCVAHEALASTDAIRVVNRNSVLLTVSSRNNSLPSVWLCSDITTQATAV